MKTSCTKESAQQVMDRCRDSGMRCTKLMKLTIEHLVKANAPLTATQIVSSEKIANHFNRGSVYRLITRLEENGIVRRLGFKDRSAYYAVRNPHDCDDYIACRVCGVVEKLEMDCPIRSMEGTIASASGFHISEHELKFFGVCPECPPTG